LERRRLGKVCGGLTGRLQRKQETYAVMRNKTKPKTELCSILNKSGKLVWTQDAYLRTCVEHFMELLNGQTDSEDIADNSCTAECSNVLDKIQVNMSDLETAMRQVKNNATKI
jgi:hypothetical protein